MSTIAKGHRLAILVLIGAVLAACGTDGETTTPFGVEASFNRSPAAGANGQGTVSITPNEVTLQIGEEVTLSGKPLNPAGRPAHGQTLVWASENDEIAFVEEDGTVVAVSPGTTRITATSTSGWVGDAEVTVTGCISKRDCKVARKKKPRAKP